MIADDDVQFLDWIEKRLRYILGDAGERVMIYRETTSAGAMERIKKVNPQIAIIDKRIDNGLTGVDIIKNIAEQGIQTTSFLISQYLDERAEKSFRLFGRKLCMQKS